MTTEELIAIGEKMLKNPTPEEQPYLALAKIVLKEAREIVSGIRTRLSYNVIFMIMDSGPITLSAPKFWRSYEQWLEDNPHLESQRTDPVEIVASEEDNES